MPTLTGVPFLVGCHRYRVALPFPINLVQLQLNFTTAEPPQRCLLRHLTESRITFFIKRLKITETKCKSSIVVHNRNDLFQNTMNMHVILTVCAHI